MRLFAAFMALTVLAAPVYAQATQEDITRLEQSLASTEQNLTTELADLSAILVRLEQDLGTQQDSVDDANSNVVALAASLATLRDTVDVLAGTVSTLENDTFEDHKVIYASLKDLADTLAEVVDAQEGIGIAQLRMRADLDSTNNNITKGFNTVNEGNEATFARADAGASKVTLNNVLAFLNLATILVVLSYITKRPKKLWRRIELESRRIDERGRHVTPNCPEEDRGLAMGEYYECPVRENCPVAETCQSVARDLAEAELATEQQGIMPIQAEEPMEDDGAEVVVVQTGDEWGS